MEIRNFVIISHIDHGKSTLADRFLELTGTVDMRHMKPQYLDNLELERERGITIKMAPVRMSYILNSKSYILNLIDTPGHSDFSYEVSRALSAVEGAILLVDAASGIQAQTLANFESAQKAGLKIIGAVNKIDAASPEQIENAINELSHLLNAKPEEIFKISGKTGMGVKELLDAVIEKVPAPLERPNCIPDGTGVLRTPAVRSRLPLVPPTPTAVGDQARRNSESCRTKHGQITNVFVVLVLTLSFVALVGVLWEFYEFILDFFNGNTGIFQGTSADTMKDLFFGLLGGTTAFAVFYKSTNS